MVARCCGKIYPCRRCHDEAEGHPLSRAEIAELACRTCAKVHPVGVAGERCPHCGNQYGRAYACQRCRVFDDDAKGQYHCFRCGICRVGGRHNFRHCDTCGCCITARDFDNHVCVHRTLDDSCPICLDDLNDTQRDVAKLACGHALHADCLRRMLGSAGRAACPICVASIAEDPERDRRLQQLVSETPMPAEYQNTTVEILCNDCHAPSHVSFHVVAMRCPRCESWNTRRV